MKTLASIVRKIATGDPEYWASKIYNDFGIKCHSKEIGQPLDPIILRQCYFILNKMPKAMVRACGVVDFYFSTTMGPNRPHYPNHGYYLHSNKSVTLNVDIFYSPDTPDDFFDEHGYFVDRPTQTLVHEMAHGFDFAHDNISKKEPWTRLSRWSETPKPGLKRLIINDPGAPRVVGEWFYDPKKEFTRYYGKRNPWDDFADCFAFYIANKGIVPENKREYLDKLLGSYYKK